MQDAQRLVPLAAASERCHDALEVRQRCGRAPMPSVSQHELAAAAASHLQRSPLVTLAGNVTLLSVLYHAATAIH